MYGTVMFSGGRPVRLGPSGETTTLTVNGLHGLSDLGETQRWVKEMAGQLSANGLLKAVSRKLCVSQRGAQETLRLAEDNTPVTPQDVLTPEGATKIARAGKKQQANARFHFDRAEKARKKMQELYSRAKKLSDPTLKAKLETDAALQARELLAEQVSASRSATAAGAALAALKFRSVALATKDESRRRNLLGQAAASVDAGNLVAQTKVQVTLPAELSKEALRARAQAGGILPNPATIGTDHVMPTKIGTPTTRLQVARPPQPKGPGGLFTSKMATRLNLNAAQFTTAANVPPATLPTLPFQAGDIVQPRTGVNTLPVNVGPLVQTPAQTDPIAFNRTEAAQLAGLGFLDNIDFGGMLSAVGGVAAAVFPAGSTVGNAVAGAATAGAAAAGGNWGAAAASAIATVGNILSPGAGAPAAQSGPTAQGMPGAQAASSGNFFANQAAAIQSVVNSIKARDAQATPALPTAQQQQVYQTIAQSTAQVTPPGMQSPMAAGGIPGWVLPVGGVGVAAILAMALLA